MRQYLDLLSDVLVNGVDKQDRTGVGTRSVFGRMFRHDLSKGFPLLTTKKLHFKSIAIELLWFISGSDNIKFLQENAVTIWDEWADADGSIGSGSYGPMWRAWPNTIFEKDQFGRCLGFEREEPIDQLLQVQSSIRNNPDSRRHLVLAWNPSEIEQKHCALPPCHYAFQFYVANNRLSCMVQIRSNDLFLGNPYNIASYALLTHMMAQTTGLQIGEIIISIGDAHLYQNHIEQAKLQLTRDPLPLPSIRLNPDITCVTQFKFDDIELIGYDAHPHIKAEVAV